MSKQNLYNIEVHVAGKAYSCVTFHFYNFEESVEELVKTEVKTVSFCRTLLDDLYDLVAIIGSTKMPDINKLVRPKLTYKETRDKAHRYFDIVFTLGEVKLKNPAFKMFSCNLILRANQSLHIIDYGRFDFEFQALQEHPEYAGIVEGRKNTKVSVYVNKTLNELSVPIKAIIEKTLGQKVSGINLSTAEHIEYAHLEGEGVLVSSGLLFGST